MNNQKKFISNRNLREIIQRQPITGPKDGVPQIDHSIPHTGVNNSKVLPIFFSPEKMIEIAGESESWKRAILQALTPKKR